MTTDSRHELEQWEGPTYQEILDEDAKYRPVSDIVRERRVVDLGSGPIPASRYTDPGFFKKEVEHVFLKSWQYACRQEEIPNVGDTYVFDLVGRSLLVVRQMDGSIRAFENICLHRGRKLMTDGGCRKAFRCPYHGFTWELDGRFRPNAVAWDFPEIDGSDFPLGEVRVAIWAGFVFANFDENAPPLEEVIEPLARHLDYWRIDECYKAAHVAKIVPANWKVVIEAFIENHHVGATHPQLAPYTGDANSQYDVLSDHVTRAIAPHGYPGLGYEGARLTPEQILQHAMRNGNRVGELVGPAFEAGMYERHYLAGIGRKNLETLTGRDLSDRCDADFLDGFSYDLFPNFHLWGSLGKKLSYRFRPVGLDHEKTLMEVFLYKLAPLDSPIPPPAQMRMLAEGEKWADTQAELSYLAGVFDQDEANMGPTQEGLRALGERPIHFGRYSEVRCRNLHRMIDVYIARGEVHDPG
jgi:phenylpropionate dioxygenase-like ring-hydroxylating dioxygenase large terminal subunit